MWFSPSFTTWTLQSFVTRNCSRLSLKRGETLLYAAGFRQDEIRKLLQFRETEADRFIYIISLTAAFEDRWARAFILIEYKWTELSNACQTATLQNTITKVELALRIWAKPNTSFYKRDLWLQCNIGSTFAHLKSNACFIFFSFSAYSKQVHQGVRLSFRFFYITQLKSNRVQKLSALNPENLLKLCAYWLFDYMCT